MTTKKHILSHFERGEILAWANPNRWGPVALVRALDEGSDTLMTTYVFEDDPDGWEPDIRSFASVEEAEAAFNKRVEELRHTPNWEAQAEYDEVHGTINGEDPGVVAMRELGW